MSLVRLPFRHSGIFNGTRNLAAEGPARKRKKPEPPNGNGGKMPPVP